MAQPPEPVPVPVSALAAPPARVPSPTPQQAAATGDDASGSVGSTSPPATPRHTASASGTALAVISDNFWLTYLPAGLERTGGGAIEPEPGVAGGWARFGSADGFVEAQVEHGRVAADWDGYRARTTLLNARATTIRGKPAVVGKHPSGGRMIVWLERVGTGAWIRVSESLGKELLAIAASVKAPVGD
ncbi:hypothetical protein HII36_02835 [Nonomuraea sp. NN258]|uniref:hypothetical protein n=1 Tax=Nonomuraea antri TaxID=2730852 RepID=UPI0015689CD0|nr:hypothetical protein [Nonomuraea antri]NRQ30775.1 hypothetical protein [Nonomuraea antri]